MSVDPDRIELETYELVLLRRTRQYHDFEDQDRERIFREHLAYTLEQVSSGRQLAAGPVTDSPADDEVICGLGLFRRGSLAEVRQIVQQDPGVQQGLYCVDVMTWHTPRGSMAFPRLGAGG